MYSSLDSLAAELGLPRPYLRKLACRGEIPFLRVRGWLRFDTEVVRAALKRLAEQTARDEAGKDFHCDLEDSPGVAEEHPGIEDLLLPTSSCRYSEYGLTA